MINCVISQDRTSVLLSYVKDFLDESNLEVVINLLTAAKLRILANWKQPAVTR